MDSIQTRVVGTHPEMKNVSFIYYYDVVNTNKNLNFHIF